MSDEVRAMAKRLLVKILDEPGSLVFKFNPVRWDEQVDIITAALQQARRETWEEIAKEADQLLMPTTVNSQFISWCRQRAREAGPIPAPSEKSKALYRERPTHIWDDLQSDPSDFNEG